MILDLHCHSTASDGVLSPALLVARAQAQGVELLSLTDHDTIEGLAPARAVAQALGIHFINGVELSCTWGGATVHLLGYQFSEDSPVLLTALERVHQHRWQRAEIIAQRLAAKGMLGAFEGARRIQQTLGDSENAPARPHFAEFLVQAGYVRDRNEAFRKWLGAGRLGDVKQLWPDLEQTVRVLRESEAWVSLAHPWQYEFTRRKRRQLALDFVRYGGQAIEVANGLQPVEQVCSLGLLARELNLLVSMGSDFHAPGDWSELGLYRTSPLELVPLWHRFL